ncbi:MAG: hypothetical protein IJE43_13620 [Alphaproteobacteria bacterium]|nr:hypothetical protein [Alphaproteobacteria bacterium]
MVQKILKLSVPILCLFNTLHARADSFFMPVKSTVCEEITPDTNRSDIRYSVYDKAILQAIKNNEYIKEKSQNLDDHQYNIISYKIADTVLTDVDIKTLQDDETKVCVELFGIVNKNDIDAIFDKSIKEKTKTVEEIAQDIKENMPSSTITSLVYINDVLYYNNTKSGVYTQKIAEYMSLEPNILVSDSLELADYIIQPRMTLSKIEKIDDKNSRFSMSVVVEVQTKDEKILHSKQKNRYIIIDNTENKQDVAGKLLLKLIKECLKELSLSINNLQMK